MKHWLLQLSVFVLAIGVIWPTAMAEVPAPRQQELLHLLKHDCGSCHGMTLKGGLGPSLLPDVIAEKPRALLISTILHGRTGTPMAPWGQFVSEQEAAWLVDALLQGSIDAR